METNPQLELASNLLKYTGSHIFLTGKAGTGKTTFLHHLRQNSPKRMIVVAPTGVAAINAKGVTIHSFFQLSFAPFIPGTAPPIDFLRIRKEKINVMRSFDLLVIDEISMVRADLLDAVDYMLRLVRRNQKPFGGIQLLMIGDMEQLSPVVKDDEWYLLNNHYNSPFFFDSLALKKTSYVCVELTTVYRQSEGFFINMLNRIREKKIDNQLLEEINKRYHPSFDPSNEEGYIILTTHNAQAQRINNDNLTQLIEKSYFFDAIVSGNFPEYSYPTDAKLELKKGAQVMFIKNDSSSEKRYYNGKIAVITRIEDNRIEAQGKDDETPILVEKVLWSNMKYSVDDETKELLEEEEGSFEQYPLKLAWAITIHKSQGLTFDKAIIDASASFAHGQVYVALSRCKTLEGLVLRSKVTAKSVIRSDNIDDFNRLAEEKIPNETQYQKLRKEYFEKMILEQFSFSQTQTLLRKTLWFLKEHFLNLYPELINLYKQTDERLKTEIIEVSEKFLKQLQQLISKTETPEEDCFLKERTIKAATYFLEKTNTILQDILDKTDIESDNKEIRKKTNHYLTIFQTEVRQKLKTLEVCSDGFSVTNYLETKSKAAIDDDKRKQNMRERTSYGPVPKVSIPSDIIYPELYEMLRTWRLSIAQEKQVPVYVVLSQMSLIGITNLLPQNKREMLQIPGIGKGTYIRYGDDILNMVNRCINRYGYEKKEPVLLKREVNDTKINTKEQSFLMFQQGKSIEDIAKERFLTVSTIEGHLEEYVKTGEITLEKLVSPEKIHKISEKIQQNPEATLSEIKASLGDDYSYGELRLVKAGYKD